MKDHCSSNVTISVLLFFSISITTQVLFIHSAEDAQASFNLEVELTSAGMLSSSDFPPPFHLTLF